MYRHRIIFIRVQNICELVNFLAGCLQSVEPRLSPPLSRAKNETPTPRVAMETGASGVKRDIFGMSFLASCSVWHHWLNRGNRGFGWRCQPARPETETYRGGDAEMLGCELVSYWPWTLLGRNLTKDY